MLWIRIRMDPELLPGSMKDQRGYLSKSRILGYTFETSTRVDVSRRLPVDVDPPPAVYCLNVDVTYTPRQTCCQMVDFLADKKK